MKIACVGPEGFAQCGIGGEGFATSAADEHFSVVTSIGENEPLGTEYEMKPSKETTHDPAL
ncbi:MAG: hypothetical protein M3R51_02025 [Candidatus Eremiobacteraeota bacterium]|nr:hypothetical protein [Candidatus Eremiobacteraeota bacterium]